MQRISSSWHSVPSIVCPHSPNSAPSLFHGACPSWKSNSYSLKEVSPDPPFPILPSTVSPKSTCYVFCPPWITGLPPYWHLSPLRARASESLYIFPIPHLCTLHSLSAGALNTKRCPTNFDKYELSIFCTREPCLQPFSVSSILLPLPGPLETGRVGGTRRGIEAKAQACQKNK